MKRGEHAQLITRLLPGSPFAGLTQLETRFELAALQYFTPQRTDIARSVEVALKFPTARIAHN